MSGLVLALFATLAVVSSAPSGIPLGLGWGGWGDAGIGLGLGAAPLGLGIGGIGAPIGIAAPAIAKVAVAAPVLAAPVAVAPAGALALTNGGGTIGVSGHGAVVSGPKTAPVVIEGPAGVVKADGLWGPTLAGLAPAIGKW